MGNYPSFLKFLPPTQFPDRKGVIKWQILKGIKAKKIPGVTAIAAGQEGGKRTTSKACCAAPKVRKVRSQATNNKEEGIRWH